MAFEKESNNEVYLPLRSDSDADLDWESSRPKSRKCSPFRASILMNTIAVLVYSLLLVLGTTKFMQINDLRGMRVIDTPANNYVLYEPRTFHQDDGAGGKEYFAATPNPQVDKNWYELFKHQNIRVDPQLVANLGRLDEAVKLPDGNYFGSLMVFHHLHCLKSIYHALHPEYYKLNNMTAAQKDYFDYHNSHCLSMLKQGLMCQGDTTLVTMRWADGILPGANFTSPHECVDWKRLSGWVKENSFDPFAPGVLVNPVSGPVFVNGQRVRYEHIETPGS